MKKNVFWLVILAMVLAGCGKTADSPSLTVAELPIPDSELERHTTLEAEAPDYSVAEICQLYLTDGQEIAESCEILGGGWIEIDNEAYYPGATYPKATWTPEELRQSYLECTAPWVAGADGPMLWSQDYEQQFLVADDWLWIDGVRALPLALETHDILPSAMLKAYQSGQWQGEKWYCADYSTYVTLDYNTGGLRYYYDVIKYDHNSDPLGVGYAGYGEGPPEFLHVEPEVLEQTGHIKAEQSVPIFLDLPQKKDGFVQARYCGLDGIYLVTNSGVEQYRRGKMIRSWKIDDCSENYFAPDTIVAGHDGAAFIHINHKIIKLLPDGTTEMIFGNIAEAQYIDNEDVDQFYVTFSQDGTLYCCELFSETIAVVDTDVDMAVSASGSPLFYTKNSGEVFVLDPEQLPYNYDQSHFLGRLDVIEYMRDYLLSDGDFQDFVAKYESDTRLSPGG